MEAEHLARARVEPGAGRRRCARAASRPGAGKQLGQHRTVECLGQLALPGRGWQRDTKVVGRQDSLVQQGSLSERPDRRRNQGQGRQQQCWPRKRCRQLGRAAQQGGPHT